VGNKHVPPNPSQRFECACEVFRVGATCKEDKEGAMCAHERCRGVRWTERKKCDCKGSRCRVVFEQRVRRVMKRYRLDTRIDEEMGHDKRREDVVQHRMAQESEKQQEMKEKHIQNVERKK